MDVLVFPTLVVHQERLLATLRQEHQDPLRIFPPRAHLPVWGLVCSFLRRGTMIKLSQPQDTPGGRFLGFLYYYTNVF